MKKNMSKGWIPTTSLALVLAFGATNAHGNGGTVINTFSQPNTCTVGEDKSIAETLKNFFKGIIGADVEESEPCPDNGTVINSGTVINN